MLLVTLDLNALIGMQNHQLRPIWEPVFANPDHLLVITDHCLLEACRAGPNRIDDIFRPLVPYRTRVRAGRRYSEVFAMETRERRPARRRDLLAAPDATRVLHDALEELHLGRPGFSDQWKDPAFVAEIERKLSLSARLVRERVDRLRNGFQITEKQFPPPASGEMTLTQKMRRPIFEESRLALCLRLAMAEAESNLRTSHAHWVVAKRLLQQDCLWLRHELAYWLRSLQLLHDDRLGSWERAGVDHQLVNEHFDVEYVVMASNGDIAACRDRISRDTLSMMGLTLERKFGKPNRTAKLYPEPVLDHDG